MTSIDVFQNNGSTVNLSAGTTTGNVALTGVGNGGTVRVLNTGTVTVFINFGTSSAVTATLAAGIPIPPNTPEAFAVGPTITHMAAITASSTASIYATTGQGA